LAAAGHTVVQFTRRGSGSNTRDRGHARSVRQLIDDVTRVVEYARKETSADRVHLVGISWGGKYAACYALEAVRSRTLASLTLVAPGIAAHVNVSGRTRAAIALSSIFAPHRRFDIPLSDPALFTDNPQRLEFIRTDPDRLNRATARFLAVSRCMDWRLARARAGAIAIPTTLILAGRDRIIDNDRTRAAVDRLTGGHATTIELTGAHTLEFESDPGRLHAALVEAAGTEKSEIRLSSQNRGEVEQ
jgi:alpha-beta hydrolase superfamily lysophospholipase